MVKLRLLFFLIVVIVGYIIITSYNLKLSEKQDQKQFISIFSKWSYKAFKNTANTIGYAIKQDWSPLNNTNKKNVTKTTN